MNRKKLLSLVIAASILTSNICVFNANAKGIYDVAGRKPTTASAKDLTNVLKQFQVSKYKGEGMVISIIDSGIDYRHKDMKLTDPSKAKIKDKSPQGKGKYFTDKVPYGYNYADKSQNIIDEGSMHGMHVAGIVAANGNSTELSEFEAIQGAAPEAQLLAMKVFSNDPDYPSCNDEDVVEAIQDSVKLGADVINMSLGLDSGFVEKSLPLQKAIKEAEEKGVVVVVSAGNAAYSTSPYKVSDVVDTSVVGSPSTAKEALSVASINNSMLVWPALTYKVGNDYKHIAYLNAGLEISPIGILKSEYDLVDCGIGTTEDFKGKDLKGKVALIKRGSISFIEKIVNAQTEGAVAAVIYNKDGDKEYISMATDLSVKIPSMFLSNEAGAQLLASIKTGTKIKFTSKKVGVENRESGKMSDFTSWGPTPDLGFKPQVTAPGGSIRSTGNNDEYFYMSGTSMAAPHTSGIMALVLQHMKELKLDNLTPKERVELAKQLVINTAKPQIDPASGEASLPFSPRRQGAGLVDAAAAVKTNVIIVNEANESTIELKQINELTKQFTLKFKNYGTKEETYTVKTPNVVLSDKSDEATDLILEGATVSFDKDKVVVPAGSVVELKVTLNIPESTTKGVFIEGFLTFEPSSKESETLGVPYMGFYGEWNESLIMDKPLWDEGSYLSETGVYSSIKNGDESLLGVVGEDEETRLPIVDENLIAVTAANGKITVKPKIKLLRNAKTLLVNVVDEQGNLIRNLGIEQNLCKDLWSPDPNDELQDDNYIEDSPWIWDLTSYNPTNGKYEVVKDGQYYFEVKASIDFATTNYQTMKLPIKVDSTAPTTSITSATNVTSRKYVLKFKASDKLSGIKDFKIMKNGAYITDKSGSTSMNLSQDADGNYYVNLDLQSGNNNITIYSTDYAENTYAYSTKIEVQPLTITSPKDNAVFALGNFELSYSADSKLLSDMRYFNILVDGQVVGKNIETLSYKFENLIPGKHQITVQAYDIQDAILEEASTNIIVKSDKLYVNFTGVKREGSFYNSTSPTLSGDLSTSVKSFKIQGIDVTVNPDLTFNKELTLQDGQNKVLVSAVDEKGKKFEYALNLYCDLLAPTLKLKDIDKNKTINVAKNIDTFKVNCEIQDNYFGFELFVNGSEISTTSDIYAKTANFETEVKLHAGMNYIEIKAVDRAGNTTTNVISVFRLN